NGSFPNDVSYGKRQAAVLSDQGSRARLPLSRVVRPRGRHPTPREIACASSSAEAAAADRPARASYRHRDRARRSRDTSAGGASAGPQRAASTSSTGAARLVLLINGGRLVVRSFPGGGRAIVLLPAPDGGSIFSLHLGSLAEDIPAGALRFLGALCGLIPAYRVDHEVASAAGSGGRLADARRCQVPVILVRKNRTEFNARTRDDTRCSGPNAGQSHAGYNNANPVRSDRPMSSMAKLARRLPGRLAGSALTAFSGGLLGLYLRTPGLRKEGSLRPTQQGIPLAKDVWMLGVGLSLVADAVTSRADSA